MPADPVIVTDHAVLRYLERVMTVDVESIRAHIAETVDHSHAVAMGCRTIQLGNGARIKLKGRTVTTVLAKGMIISQGDW